MNRSEYYETLKALARDIRVKYSLSTPTVSLTSLRKIYRDENIRIDYSPQKMKKVRGAYMVIDDQAHVLINSGIKPKEPRIFIMSHELKHHYVDFELAKSGPLECEIVSWSNGSPLEIGAEIFASELIYPESEFQDLIKEIGIDADHWKAEDVVILKRKCLAPVSYKFLEKRLEWFGLVPRGTFAKVQFNKLEEKMFGVPFYRRIRQG